MGIVSELYEGGGIKKLDASDINDFERAAKALSLYGPTVGPAILAKLELIIKNQEKSLMNEEELKQALTDIEEATTEQGQALDTLSTASENLAKDIEAFINKPVPAGGPSAEDVARAKNLAARAKSIGGSLKLQAEFATALAAKTEDGSAVVIPEVPAPLPEPAPLPV